MNVLLKRLQVTCVGVLVSACAIPQQIQLGPVTIPTFSHSTPIREVQSGAPLLKRIQPAVVYFANDSHDITLNAKKNLTEFLNQLADTAWPSIVIEGHTDANNSEVYNLNLSSRRTKNIKKTLIRLGYPAHQMIEIAKGEIQPIASNATASGRQLNRRVVIRLYQTPEKSNVMTALLKH